MKKESFLRSVVSAAKYMAALFIAVYTIWLFKFAGLSTKPFCEMQEALEKAVKGKGLKADDKGFKRSYGLNAADYDGVMYYRAQNYFSAEEILLVKAKNKGQVREIRRAVEKRLKERRSYFAGFSQDKAKLIDGSVLSVRGRYIFLAVADNARKYQEMFLENL